MNEIFLLIVLSLFLGIHPESLVSRQQMKLFLFLMFHFPDSSVHQTKPEHHSPQRTLLCWLSDLYYVR